MRGQNFLPATASLADSERYILILRGILELINISILLFCATGIISPRPDASLSGFFAPQGLFRPAGCISILLFCSTGIISTGQMHLYLALLFHRDYFHRSDASLSCFFAPQGLFRPAGCISIMLFCSTRIISTGQMHLYLALLLHRDYFAPVRYVPHR